MDGSVQKNLPIRVLRNQTVIYEGVLESAAALQGRRQQGRGWHRMRHRREELQRRQGGDQIECFQRIEVKRTVKADDAMEKANAR